MVKPYLSSDSLSKRKTCLFELNCCNLFMTYNMTYKREKCKLPSPILKAAILLNYPLLMHAGLVRDVVSL